MTRRLPDQLDAFRSPDIPREPVRQPAYQASSETSKEAAGKVASKASALRAVVLQSIIAAGERGATRRELEQSTGMLTQTITPRLNELEFETKDIRKLQVINDKQELVTVKRDGCSIYVIAKAKAAA